MTRGRCQLKQHIIKDMPRQARLDAPGVLHHVMARGIEQCSIFRDDRDREEFKDRSKGDDSNLQ
jgi:hypothetical protein